jgi:hypothetical protein
MFVVYHDEESPQSNRDFLMNGVFGASKCHPAMEHIIRSVQLLHSHLFYRQNLAHWQRTGPGIFSAALKGFPLVKIERDIFAPGSWFFPVRGNFLDTVNARLIEIRKRYPLS